jgi:NTP pyrophosphatase (non-canonical NTP hydrolase)
MQANEYQQFVSRTMNKGLLGREAISNYCMGLAGEVGEVVEPLKKFLYHGKTVDYAEVKKELGDVCWYVAALANELGIELNDVLEQNVEKLQKRYPDGFKPQQPLPEWT